ncbi:Holliday junction resolvase RuvX [Thermophagus xiamenensis]|uniref:Putative pre-16S rRNA nuclease n=1 Tax=Thermophagus xiamenensis TaxID=385682 RepID=A0A1I1VBJ8_9BACT|nr:Holliday junction resolvase RuvX [Thermophagus xiamenensis]SFD80165.1 putative holliday junction resolvase [Thermophagus xiamenensis]
MGRILAFDYGKKKTGIAVTDPLKIIANGLDTIPSAKIYEFLKDYLAREDVEAFVVGYATRDSGEDSESMKYIRPFVRSLKNKYPHIPVYMVDERYTSKMAFQTMIDAGLSKKKRRDKWLIDKISATIILQTFLEENQ